MDNVTILLLIACSQWNETCSQSKHGKTLAERLADIGILHTYTDTYVAALKRST